MMYQFLVVEDDVLIAEDIKQTLKDYGISNILLAHSFEEAVRTIKLSCPDFVLLDIRMERELDGFEIAKLLNEKYHIPFMFVTSHSDQILVKKLIGVKPLAYITKPINKFNFFAQIQLALTHLDDITKEKNMVYIKDGFNKYKLDLSTIKYISCDSNYLNIYTEQDKYNTRMSLSEILDKLPDSFVKTHRSFIVNIKKVEEYQNSQLKIGNESFPVSRGMRDNFLKIMEKYAIT